MDPDAEVIIDTLPPSPPKPKPLEPWFLLYGGTSEDGAGPGRYVGRTTDRDAALRHFHEIKRNPYSTGGVDIVTDSTLRRALHASDIKPVDVEAQQKAVADKILDIADEMDRQQGRRSAESVPDGRRR